MPVYNYRGIDHAGKKIKGIITAPDVIAIESKLAGTGSVLLEAEESVEKESGDTRISFLNRGPKDRELIDFFITSSSLLKAGVTFLDALRAIKEEVESPVFRNIIGDMISSVEEGKSFSDSLANHPRVFSDHILGLIRAGEFGGKLQDTFKELVRYLEWKTALKANIKQATIYPVTVLIALTGLILMLFTFVVPRFSELLTSLNVPLPFPTRIVMSISKFFVSTWWILLLTGIITFFVFTYARRLWNGFALFIDNVKLNIMVFGELNRMLTISKFAYNLSALLEAGVPVIRSLELCEPLVGNKVMEKALNVASGDVAGGMLLNESLRKHEIFPRKTLLMITVGEASGDLGETLRSVSNYYTEEIPRRIKKVFSIMEPLVMFTLIGVVGFTAAAILLPILRLFGAVGQ
jgi:type II secretory pathway component PulF